MRGQIGAAARTTAIISEERLGRAAARAGLAFLLVFCASYFPIVLVKGGEVIAPFWPANAIAIVALARAPHRGAPRAELFAAVVAAIFLGNLLAGNDARLSLWFTLANTFEIVVALFFLTSRGPLQQLLSRLDGNQSFLRVCAAGAVAGLLGGAVGAVGLAALGMGAYLDLWFSWSVPSALGIMLFAPLGLVAFALKPRTLLSADGARRIALCVAPMALLCGLSFALQAPALFFFTTILVLVAAHQLGAFGVAIAIVAGLVVTAAPIAGAAGAAIIGEPHTAQGRVLLMQIFFLVQAFVGLFVAALRDTQMQLSHALRREAEAARAESQRKQRLLMSAAHDIRTPLNVIMGLSDTLAMRADRESDQALFGVMNGAAKQLQALAVDLLDAARLEMDALQIDAQWIDAASETRRAIETVAAALGASPTMIQLDVREDARLFADPIRYQQIVQNLVSNALKYGGEFGPVRVEVRVAETHARICVTDRGPGFAPGAARTAFEAAGGRGPRGAGVGLSIVKMLAEAHGGAVGLRSAPHVETRVWADLPLRGRAEAASPDGDSARGLEAADPDAIFGPL